MFSSSSSRSVSPDGKMEFITEFGGDVPTPSSSSTVGHMTKPRHPSSSSGRRKRRSSSSSESGSSSPPPRKRRHHSRDGHYYHRSHHHSDTSGDRDKSVSGTGYICFLLEISLYLQFYKSLLYNTCKHRINTSLNV